MVKIDDSFISKTFFFFCAFSVDPENLIKTSLKSEVLLKQELTFLVLLSSSSSPRFPEGNS